MRQASGPGCSGRRIRAAGAAQTDAGRVGAAGSGESAAAASTTVSAASSASDGVPRTTRKSARRSSGVAASSRVPGGVPAHRGMFPCLRIGAASRLVARVRSARPT